MICSTYWVKLIPFYAGYPEPAVRLAALLRWYRTATSGALETLNLTSLMPAGVIVPLGAAVVLAAATLAAALTRLETRSRHPLDIRVRGKYAGAL